MFHTENGRMLSVFHLHLLFFALWTYAPPVLGGFLTYCWALCVAHELTRCLQSVSK